MRLSPILGLLLVASVAFSQTSTSSTDDDSHWDSHFRYMGFDFYGLSDFCFAGDTIIGYGNSRCAAGYRSPGIAYYDGTAWHPMNTGSNDYAGVYVATPFGRYLFAGGDFVSIGGVAARSLARWDWQSHSWSPVGSGLAPSLYNGRAVVNAMLRIGDDIYVAGSFDSAGGVRVGSIARYNIPQNKWYTLGRGISGGFWNTIYTLATDSTYLYVGGSFDTAGGIPAPSIARWNLQSGTWDAMNAINTNGSQISDVLSIYPWNGSVVIGGDFDSIGDISAPYVARYDGTWHAFGSLTAPPDYFTDFNGELLESGSTAGIDSYWGDYTHWNGTDWVGLHWTSDGNQREPTAIPGAMHVHNSRLYATGGFLLDSTFNHRIAYLHLPDSNWIPIDDVTDFGPSSRADYLAAVGAKVYVSGHHGNFFDGFATTIETYDGNHWLNIDRDSEGSITGPRIFSDSANLYRLMDFQGDSTYWSPMALQRYDAQSGTWVGLDTIKVLFDQCTNCSDNYIKTSLLFGGSFYIAGKFHSVNGVTCRNVARLDLKTGQWSPVGTGISCGQSGYVLAMQFFHGDLYAAGSFDTTHPNILRFNSRTGSWDPFGDTTMRGFVSQLTSSSSVLYAAGSFTEIGGKQAYVLAKWDGAEWDDLGLSPADRFEYFYAMTPMHDTELVIGGTFWKIGKLVVNNIARWDGHNWHALGAGTSDNVTSLVSVGDDLYVGGWFTTAGQVAANGFAHWSSSNSASEPGPSANSALDLHAYPNPTSGSLAAHLNLPSAARLELDLYTTTGVHIAKLLDQSASAGAQFYSFDLSSLNLADGPYFLEARANAERAVTQIHVIK